MKISIRNSIKTQKMIKLEIEHKNDKIIKYMHKKR